MLRRSLLRSTTILTAAIVASSTGISLAQATCVPTVWDLTAGQTIKVGTVTVSNDTTYLYVTYKLDTTTQPTAKFGTLHLWAGTDLTLLPAVKNGPNAGIPIPGQFPFITGKSPFPDATGTTEYTFKILLADLSITDITKACGLKLYVVTHAEVKNVEDSGGNTADQTAFGGDKPINVEEPGRWWYYGVYSVCCDEGTPVLENCQTAFAKGQFVFTTDSKSNPESLDSLRLSKNRWGWAINLVNTTSGTPNYYDIWAGAGLNRTSNGTKVGQLAITWDGSEATITYDLFDGFVMKELHVYADDAKPTTVAPGQYGHTQYFDPEVDGYSVTLPLTSSSAPYDGAWVIAHAVVCKLES
ncbi:MAG TPA: hypothetical protein VHL31_16305 [Geminicoccus sp.]|jgi:hypothetical protein|uniref:hypothetical protein n=1 Tax=Geminicoccus sp. TaxID=2024832 RepID=UPI002E35899B|nr:hypothetical protein [Geminicoccus sp.]HEX2527846.1 hypothetical protein [Geminicoccus sp.]